MSVRLYFSSPCTAAHVELHLSIRRQRQLCIRDMVHDEGDLSNYPYTRCLKVDIFGNDRPSIVSQLTQAISGVGANIEELSTTIESAAMSGHPIFHATGTVCLPDSIAEETLITAVEDLSDDLNVEISVV